LDDARALTQFDCAARPPLTVNMSFAGPPRSARSKKPHVLVHAADGLDRRLDLRVRRVRLQGLVQLLLRGIARCLRSAFPDRLGVNTAT
jgi:hypothetical protein